MSVAKKEEVCSHTLGLHLVEPSGGVPIKKRPVLVSDKSVPSGVPPSTKLSYPATGMPASASGVGCSKESLNTHVIAKGKGLTNSWDQTHANMSFIPSVTEKKGVLVNGSSEMPSSGESDRGSVAPVDESDSQKFLTLDLQLASRRNGKINYSSVVKEEKVDKGFSGFPTAEPLKDVQRSEMKSSSSNFGKLPNLDLNVPLDPADSLEGLPTMHEGSNRLCHTTVENQKAQVPLAVPVSTISGGLSRNIDSTLNLSNAYGLSNKRGAADVTLDLQLKPPARPEIGINWKGLAPAPELSLSLFGKHTDEPKDLSVPDAVVKSEPVGSAKKITGEAATPGSDKSPVEKIVKFVPCNANPQRSTPSTVSGNEKQPSSSSVKKEPEEPFQQPIQNNVEKAPLFEQQSVGLVNDCAEVEKTDNTQQVLSKAGFDLNSENFLNNSTRNGLVVATDSVPVPTARLHDVVSTQTMPAVPEVEKFIKREEIATAIPSPVIATACGQPAPSIVKSLPLERNIASPAVGLCESASQPPICSSEPACCNPDGAAADCKPTVSLVHAHEYVTCKPCKANEACDVSRSSSNPTAEALIFNSRDHAVFDGMSQGSAEMDCSDDDDNTTSQLPSTNKPHVESLGNSQITAANSLCAGLQKEHDSDTHDCSSVTNKVQMQGADDDKRVNIKDGIATHSGEEGHQSEVFVNGKFKDKQLLTSDNTSPVNNTDVAMQDVKNATGFSSTDLIRSSALGTSASPKIESTRQSHKTLNDCLEKSRSPVIKSERSQSPHGKQAANCSKDNAKNVAVKSEHGTESEEVVESDLHPKDLVLGEDSHLDGASSSQPQNECTQAKSASERSEYEESKPDSCRTSSVQNERDGQVDGSHRLGVGYTYVNRNERWERFMESEREKNKGEYQGGRHASGMINQRRTDHRHGGCGAGSRGHPRNFRGARMNNESEIAFADEHIIGRRRPFEDDLGHLHRIQHRRRRSPPMNNQMPGCHMREMDLDRFSGREIPNPRLLAHEQLEDIPDDMMEERFFVPHSHPQHAQGDRAFIHRESHSPVQRRGVPMHFHRGRSPEGRHRSPPLIRTDRPYVPHRRHTRQYGSPFDRIRHDERGMQRNMRRCGVHQGVQGDTFEPHLHPAQLAELHAEAELTERRKFGDRRAYLRSLEESPVGDEEEILSYDGEGDMDFAEGGGGPRELDGRFRSRMEHRARGEQEDGYRYRGPQGWRDGNSNGSRPKRRY